MKETGNQGTLTVWLPLVSACATLIFGMYGLHRAWQQHRREKREQLMLMAQTAVRVTEASFVRPLLRERLRGCLETRFYPHYVNGAEPGTTDRMRLFCWLQHEVLGHVSDTHIRFCIWKRPKNRRHACAHSTTWWTRSGVCDPVLWSVRGAALSRGQNDPKITTDKQLAGHQSRLFRKNETSYNLTPRPSGVLILELAQFCYNHPQTA